MSIWLANLADFHFFFSSVFIFLNLVVHTLCSLASYKPTLITNFFFFFGSLLYTVAEYLTPLISVFVFGGCVCVLGWTCCILFGLDFFKAQKLWMDFEVIHYSTWAWASHIIQVSILELKLGKKQFKKILKII